MNKTNQKGFTVFELIVTIAIAGIITVAISSFLVSHIKTYEAMQEITTIQYEAQLALNNMSKVALQSKGIYEVLKSGSSEKDFSTSIDPNIIVFEDISYYYVFLFDESTNKMYYHKVPISGGANFSSLPKDAEHEFARTIQSIKLVANVDSSGATLKNCDAVEIYFTLASGEASYNVRSQVKFRN